MVQVTEISDVVVVYNIIFEQLCSLRPRLL
jgi:hypothetical protein